MHDCPPYCLPCIARLKPSIHHLQTAPFHPVQPTRCRISDTYSPLLSSTYLATMSDRRRQRCPSLGDVSQVTVKRAHTASPADTPSNDVITLPISTRVASVSTPPAHSHLDAAHSEGANTPLSDSAVALSLPVEVGSVAESEVGPGSSDRATDVPNAAADDVAVARPTWCLCGACEEETEQKVGAAATGKRAGGGTVGRQQPSVRTQLCCLEVIAKVENREDGGQVCKADAYTSIMGGDLGDEANYEYYSKRRLSLRGDPPTSFDECSNKQKRTVLYAVLFERLEEKRGWKDGVAADITRGSKRKIMPACIHQAVNRLWPGDE